MGPGGNTCSRCSKPLDTAAGAVCESCLAHDGQPLPTVAPRSKDMKDLLPESIGGHEVTGILGSGGMGKVYLAREPALGRDVALKVLKKDASQHDVMESMLEEAVVTGRLAHPGIVPIYQVGRDPQLGLWYTMKVVEGKSLADVLNGLRDDDPEFTAQFPLPALLGVFKRACDAVAFAHHNGVVHRDLKPSNVMIGEFGEVLVMDWGLARILDKDRTGRLVKEATKAILGPPAPGTAPAPETRAIMGTPGYMSPEQARGQSAGPPADVYALGAILYQILTLRLPVDGRVQEMIARTAGGQIVPAEKRPLGKTAPKSLCQIANKALALDPAARFPDARAMGREIDAYLEGRVPWHPREEGWQSAGGAWDVAEGRLRSGPGVKSKAFHRARLGSDVRFAATMVGSKDRAATDTSIWVATRGTNSPDGYEIRLMTGADSRVEFLRNGALVARRLDIRLDSARDHKLLLLREGARLQLTIDGLKAIEHREIFPMRGEVLAVSSESSGVSLAGVRVENHGPPLQLDFLALPDKIQAMGQLAEARVLFRDMAEAHSDRSEGVIARYKAALCSIEMGEAAEAQADLALLDGTGYEALRTLGTARLRQREGHARETWTTLLQGLEKHRGDPARIELRAMINAILEQAERRDSAAAARELYMELFEVPGLMPQETAQVCAEFLRMSSAGGPERVRQEALGLLDRYRQRVELRMECHASLARTDLPKDAAASARSHLERTLGLADVLTDDDRARLVLWLTESLLAGDAVGEAEAALASAAAAMEPGAAPSFRIRLWRVALSSAQGKWPDARRLLEGAGAATKSFPGVLLTGLLVGGESGAPKGLAVLQERMQAVADWKPALEALAGRAPTAPLEAWIERQAVEYRPLLAAGAAMFAAQQGNKPAAEALRARAAAEKSGRHLLDWMIRNKRFP